MSFLNLNSGGGGAYIRFLPSANSWTLGKEEIDLKRFVMDHNTIRTGWGKMGEGAPPEWIWDATPGAMGPQPSADHKRGFSIKIFIKGVGSLEWSSTGTGPVIGFEAIFEQIWTEKDANQGAVPILDYQGSEAMRIGKGNTRKPKFAIVGWAPHASVPWDAASAPANKPAPAPPPAPATQKPAPVKGPMSFDELDDDGAPF